jgi:hypothetical protein
MDRLVDVYARFYLLVDKKLDPTTCGEFVKFRLKTLREDMKRAKIPGSRTDDLLNIEFASNEVLYLHPESATSSYNTPDAGIATSQSLILDESTLTARVFAFTPAKVQSGHTISSGTLALYADDGLVTFLQENAGRNLRAEAQQKRNEHARARAAAVGGMRTTVVAAAASSDSE